NNGATFDGANDFFAANDSASLSFNFANTIEGWTKFDSNFGNNTHDQNQTIVDKGAYKLYYDHTTGKINYEMVNASATTNWTQVGGNNLNGGWDLGHASLCAQANDGTNVYVALCGSGASGAVWKW